MKLGPGVETFLIMTLTLTLTLSLTYLYMDRSCRGKNTSPYNCHS